MKTNFLKLSILTLFTASIFTSCVKDDDFDIPNFKCNEVNITANKTVADVYALAGTTIQQYPEVIGGDDYLEAYVVSSDRGGNFFKSISLQTVPTQANPQPIGFSVPVDVVSLSNIFEVGRKVYVKLDRRYFNITNGSLIIGEIFIGSTGTVSVGRISPFDYGNVLFRSCEVKPEADLVRTLTVNEAKQDVNLNTLIELDGVQFVDAAVGKTYYDPNAVVGGATNHLLTDAEGSTVIFRTSSFATYAGQVVPGENGKVRGVMTKFGNDYQFIARTFNDIQLNNPRLTPLFSENFESVPTGTTANIALPGWTNVQMNGVNPRWTGRIFSNNKYAQMSAFQSNNTNVDSRLITPGINLDNSTDEFLRFGYKTGFANGQALTVWYSTNYSGAGTVEAVNSATWTQFPVVLNVQDTSFASEFYTSGQIDLSNISGTIYISFRYEGSSSGVTTTYQIDNIEVIGNN
jgi:hypothetical protein